LVPATSLFEIRFTNGDQGPRVYFVQAPHRQKHRFPLQQLSGTHTSPAPQSADVSQISPHAWSRHTPLPSASKVQKQFKGAPHPTAGTKGFELQSNFVQKSAVGAFVGVLFGFIVGLLVTILADIPMGFMGSMSLSSRASAASTTCMLLVASSYAPKTAERKKDAITMTARVNFKEIFMAAPKKWTWQ
jgi:hypothetical protein